MYGCVCVALDQERDREKVPFYRNLPGLCSGERSALNQHTLPSLKFPLSLSHTHSHTHTLSLSHTHTLSRQQGALSHLLRNFKDRDKPLPFRSSLETEGCFNFPTLRPVPQKNYGSRTCRKPWPVIHSLVTFRTPDGQ